MIRPYYPSTDESEIIRLIRTELIPLSHIGRQQGVGTYEELTARLRQGIVYVASRRRTSSPLGFVHLLRRGDSLFVDMLAVQPHERGKRIGAGLMAAAEAYGMSIGSALVRLFVDEGNDRARSFYARLGYRVVRFDPHYRCHEMVKALAAGSAGYQKNPG